MFTMVNNVLDYKHFMIIGDEHIVVVHICII